MAQNQSLQGINNFPWKNSKNSPRNNPLVLNTTKPYHFLLYLDSQNRDLWPHNQVKARHESELCGANFMSDTARGTRSVSCKGYPKSLDTLPLAQVGCQQYYGGQQESQGQRPETPPEFSQDYNLVRDQPVIHIIPQKITRP